MVGSGTQWGQEKKGPGNEVGPGNEIGSGSKVGPRDMVGSGNDLGSNIIKYGVQYVYVLNTNVCAKPVPP